jgi:FHA domain
MSLVRLIIWSCLIGGWAAFLGWLVLEVAVGRWVGQYDIVAIIMATVIAVPIGGGISLANGLTNAKIDLLVKRLLFGFAGGLVGGLLGILLGSCMFAVFSRIADYITFLGIVGRILGWGLIGVGIGAGVGASEGITERSMKKLRNGLIGGILGGFLGGLFFYPMSQIATDVSSRAFAFVLLGLCIGLFIGLAQVILKEAWLTVEQGFRSGRQMILGRDPITMGTSEKSSLIFIAYGAKGVEPIHLKITKQKDGAYLLEDNQSRTGTLLNGAPVSGPTPLKDGDTIQFGVNVVRFNERVSHGTGQRLPPPAIVPAAKPTPVPAAAIQAQPPAPKPVPAAAIPTAAPAPKPGVPVGAVKAPPAAPPKPKPAAPPQPQEGRCPICDRKIVGIPGERRCGKCFTTF